jgi:hypothetical protein
MTKSKIIALVAVITLAFAATAIGNAVAGEKVQQKVRAVFQYFKAEAAKVGDVPGHVVGVSEANGLTFPEKDEPGAYSVQVMFDYVNGSGPHWGYVTSTWEDGSTTVIKVEGTTTATQGGKISLFKGTYTYVKGTGRYAGIEGSGSYTGKRLTPMAAGAFCYSDATETYTLP